MKMELLANFTIISKLNNPQISKIYITFNQPSTVIRKYHLCLIKLMLVSCYPPNLHESHTFSLSLPIFYLLCLHVNICTGCCIALKLEVGRSARSVRLNCEISFPVVRKAVLTSPHPRRRSSSLDTTRAEGETFSGDHVQSGQGQSMFEKNAHPCLKY